MSLENLLRYKDDVCHAVMFLPPGVIVQGEGRWDIKEIDLRWNDTDSSPVLQIFWVMILVQKISEINTIIFHIYELYVNLLEKAHTTYIFWVK